MGNILLSAQNKGHVVGNSLLIRLLLSACASLGERPWLDMCLVSLETSIYLKYLVQFFGMIVTEVNFDPKRIFSFFIQHRIALCHWVFKPEVNWCSLLLCFSLAVCFLFLHNVSLSYSIFWTLKTVTLLNPQLTVYLVFHFAHCKSRLTCIKIW